MSSDGTFDKWIRMTSCRDQFSLVNGRCDVKVSCEYSKASYMAAVDGDMIIVLPVASHIVQSHMVGHTILQSTATNIQKTQIVEFSIPRPLVRCGLHYQFAYVSCDQSEVMGTSDTFMFIHQIASSCDCDTSIDDDDNYSDSTTRLRPLTTASINSFIRSLAESRLDAQCCMVCKVPVDHQQILEYLTENIDCLTNFNTKINWQHFKKSERLNCCFMLLEHQKIKIEMLKREIEYCQRFVNELVVNLIKNHKAVFKTGNHVIFVKTDNKSKQSAHEHLMNSIINNQKEIIAHLENKTQELSILIRTTQLFAKAL